jgi:hypothetical protein
MAGEKGRTQCGCSGACCGEQTYGQMRQAFLDRYNGVQGYTVRELDEIHRRWRKIASRL